MYDFYFIIKYALNYCLYITKIIEMQDINFILNTWYLFVLNSSFVDLGN